MECDILMESLRLVVEYDGAYWHESKVRQDRRKTALLRRAGWQVIRIREAPLTLLHPQWDLQVDLPRNEEDHLALVKAVLLHIERKLPGTLDPVTLAAYLEREQLVAREAAEEEIGAMLAYVPKTARVRNRS